MKFTQHIKEGWGNLLSAKLRSLLALLGILVGTASVVAMVGGGELATYEALKQFKTLGTDLLALSVTDTSPNTSENRQLSIEQTQELANQVPAINALAPYTQLFSPIEYEGHLLMGSILGITESFADIIHINLTAGRFISLLDQYAMFCVIGAKIARDIEAFTLKPPLGQQIKISKNYFTIVGIASAWEENSFVYANIDNTILIPILTSMALSKYATINNVILRLQANADIEGTEQSLKTLLNQLLPSKSIYFRSAKEIIARMEKQSQIFTVFLGLIGSISLLVGGIGVMNIMLVSVVERRREIGIRLAVGAKRKDIRTLFLIEAIMLSVTGGVIGVLLGLLIIYIMALIWHWQFIFFLLPPLIGFSVSVAIGIFFGFYPAYQASCLDPIDALRTE